MLTAVLIVGYSYRIRERNPPRPTRQYRRQNHFYQPAAMSAARPTRPERRPHENELVFYFGIFFVVVSSIVTRAKRTTNTDRTRFLSPPITYAYNNNSVPFPSG